MTTPRPPQTSAVLFAMQSEPEVLRNFTTKLLSRLPSLRALARDAADASEVRFLFTAAHLQRHLHLQQCGPCATTEAVH